jgi:hypothetical protein
MYAAVSMITEVNNCGNLAPTDRRSRERYDAAEAVSVIESKPVPRKGDTRIVTGYTEREGVITEELIPFEEGDPTVGVYLETIERVQKVGILKDREVNPSIRMGIQLYLHLYKLAKTTCC